MNTAEALQELYPEEIYQLPAKPLVVIPVPWESLSDASVDRLSKIMMYLKSNLNKVQVISTKNLDERMIQAYRPSRILLFGATTTPAITPHELTTFCGIPAVAGEALEALDTLDSARKTRLLSAMSTMFQE